MAIRTWNRLLFVRKSFGSGMTKALKFAGVCPPLQRGTIAAPHLLILLGLGVTLLTYSTFFGVLWHPSSIAYYGKTKPMTLEVLPRICFAPCSVRVRVQVTPEEDNRKLFVRMSGEKYESSSTVQLEGEASPKTFPYFWFKDLPSGLYSVEAYLQDYEDKVTAQEASTVEIGGFDR